MTILKNLLSSVLSHITERKTWRLFKKYDRETLVSFISYINTAKYQRMSDWLYISTPSIKMVGIKGSKKFWRDKNIPRQQESEKNSYLFNIKQILHAFFNIRNYSPEASNIQGHEAELNIILPWVSNFDVKHKLAWNICFITYPQHSIIYHQHKYCMVPATFILSNYGKSIH